MGFFKSTPTATAPPPPPVQPVVVEEKKGFFGLGRKKTVVRDPNNSKSLSSPTSPGHNKLVSPTSPTHVGVFNKTRLDEVHTQIPAAYVVLLIDACTFVAHNVTDTADLL